jgi:glycosyltransferase involved in cell wall biosynthesis
MRASDKEIYLSVIIPAYNEEKRIGATLLSIDKYLSIQKYSYEILVVSDGSSDKTVDVVDKYKKLVKNLEVIDNLENKGKGAVVRQGMLAARGKYRIFMDADNSTSIDHVEKMWPMFNSGNDIVIGTRDSRDSKEATQSVSQPLTRRIIGDIGNLLIQITAVPGIWDTQCGFKGFSDKAVKDIFSRLKINRWGFDIEILAIAKRLNYKIGIIPVRWENDARSHVTLGGYLNTFRELFIVRWNLIVDKYGIKSKK